MNVQQMIEVMQAYASGKSVQFRALSQSGHTWLNTQVPAWDWSCFEYRISPLLKEMWVVSRGCTTLEQFCSQANAEHFSKHCCAGETTITHYKEVVND